MLLNSSEYPIYPQDFKRFCLESFNIKMSKIELLKNNHFHFFGELEDPEGILSCSVQNIDKKRPIIYIDFNIFCDGDYHWDIAKLINKLRETCKPDKIIAEQDYYNLDTGDLRK